MDCSFVIINYKSMFTKGTENSNINLRDRYI